jgi:hypothetical protein
MSIKIKDLTVKNFLSVGNHTQAVDFNKEQITLVLGENLDQGGDDSGSRNGTGKCLCTNTVVKLRDTITGEVYEITIGDLYNAYNFSKRR